MLHFVIRFWRRCEARSVCMIRSVSSSSRKCIFIIIMLLLFSSSHLIFYHFSMFFVFSNMFLFFVRFFNLIIFTALLVNSRRVKVLHPSRGPKFPPSEMFQSEHFHRFEARKKRLGYEIKSVPRYNWVSDSLFASKMISV